MKIVLISECRDFRTVPAQMAEANEGKPDERRCAGMTAEGLPSTPGREWRAGRRSIRRAA
jgi:hypothetical protein